MAEKYGITPVEVKLSMNWGIKANDYTYTDYNRVTGSFQTVKVDFQDLMVRVGARKAAVVEAEITPMATRMRSRNAYLANLSTILAELTRVQAGFSGDDDGKTSATVNLSSTLLSLLRAIPGVVKSSW